MTRSGFFLTLCLTAAIVVGSLAIAANPGSDNTPTSIENSLAVQKAILQAKDFLVQSEAKKAVDVLEANLGRINGDRRYLMLLRDAYRAHVKDLMVANQPAAAEVYQNRLKILEEQQAGEPQPPAQAAAAKPAPAVAPQVTTTVTQDPPKPAASAPPPPVAKADPPKIV